MLERVLENAYLDGKKVNYYGKNKALAYLMGTNYGTAKTDAGFISFYLKDINQYTITGRMFDVQNFLESGRALANLRKQAVEVEFIAQEFNGGLSLIISTIQAYSGNDFDYSLFLGKLARAEEILVSVNSIYEKHAGITGAFPSTFVHDTYTNVCGSLVGGYVKLIQMVSNSIVAFSGTPGVVIKDLLFVASKVLNTYAEYLELQDRINLQLKHNFLQLIYNASQGIEDLRMRNIYTDAMSAVLGFGKPQHLYAHIINKMLINTQELLGYSYEYPLVVEGSAKTKGDQLLARY
jgi:hypothetical protein